MPAGEGVQADGVVKWFNGSKGFGFVAISNNPQDAFLHISVVTRAGLQGLAENTRLRCLVAPSERGMQVTHILEVMGVDPNAPPQENTRQNSGGGHRRERDDFAPRDNYRDSGRRDSGRSDFGGRDDYGHDNRRDSYGRDDYGHDNRRDNFGGGYSHGFGDGSGGGEKRAYTPRESTGPEVEITGSIKWFKPDKGFGFAMPDDGGKDVFIHRSMLDKLGMDNIESGRKIRMSVTTSQKGREATSMDIID
jgi:cold shock protein